MRAILFDKKADPFRLVGRDMPLPVPKDGEIPDAMDYALKGHSRGKLVIDYGVK